MKEFLAKYLSGVAASVTSGITGFWGLIVKYASKIVIKLLVKLGIKWNEKLKAKKELKEYEEKLADPNLSKEERKLADKSFIGDN